MMIYQIQLKFSCQKKEAKRKEKIRKEKMGACMSCILTYEVMQKGNADQYTYGGWWSVWWMGTYSMVLSKAAFFHQKYLSLYTYQMPASIREYVAKNRFACDQEYFLSCIYLMLVLFFYP